MLRAAVALGFLTAALAAPVATAAPGDLELVSVASSGAQGDGGTTERVARGERYRVRSSQSRTVPQ